MTEETLGIYVSEPFIPLSAYRADPLGLKGFANHIAEQLAPGFSGRIIDARWVTILCAAIGSFRRFLDRNPMLDLENYYDMFCKFEQAYIHAMLPIIQGEPDTRMQLPGKLAVQKGTWYPRYRSYGPYGSYRKFMIHYGFLDNKGWGLGKAGATLSDSLAGFEFAWENRKKKIEDLLDLDTSMWRLSTDLGTKEKETIFATVFGSPHDKTPVMQTVDKMRAANRDLEAFWSSCDHLIGLDPALLLDFFKFSCEAMNQFADMVEMDTTELSDPNSIIASAKLILEHDCPHHEFGTVVALAKAIVERQALGMLEHHLSLPAKGKKWFFESADGYKRIYDTGDSIQRAYTFRLNRVWDFYSQSEKDESQYFDRFDFFPNQDSEECGDE